MIVVILCAVSKKRDAGRLRTAVGKPILFVADPQAAPSTPGYLYARPDDPSEIPIPPLYFGKTLNGDLEVIEGQQRLTTLINFVAMTYRADPT
jgi:hypothetical protein